jgi:hypothetical protein
MPCCAHSSTFEILFNKLLIRNYEKKSGCILLKRPNRGLGGISHVSM